jgi:hypothetical protein
VVADKADDHDYLPDDLPKRLAAALTASTSSRDHTLKQYSASVCVLGSAIGSFANYANGSPTAPGSRAPRP